MSKWLVILILCLSSSPLFGWQDKYDSLVQRSQSKDIWEAESGLLKGYLLKEAPKVGELDLWNALWIGTPRERASAGLALIEALYPKGDPSRWEEVKGFIYPSETPKSLMAVDGIFVSITSLMDIDGGDFLAASLLDAFGSSSRAKHLFVASLPKDMSSVLSRLVTEGKISGFWDPSVLIGKLPLAVPVRGTISQGSAVAKGMQFLDGAGVPSSNGPYCWDRSSGKIYKVIDRARPLWIPGF